jgi:peroxiredoxin
MRFLPLSILILLAASLPAPLRAKPADALRDLRGNSVNLASLAAGKVRVFIFTRRDCPVSNAYAPEVARLVADYTPKGAAFWLVYPDPDERPERVRKHLEEYSYPCPALLDPAHELATKAGARITPEAAVFSADGKLLYCGRIDDRYVDYGRKRAEAGTRDLANAIAAALSGKPVPKATGAAVGCFIEDLRK